MSRSLWKSFVILHENVGNSLNSQEIYTKNRSIHITLSRVGYTYKIYNGIRWVSIQITPERVNQLLGEFVATRKRPIIKKKQKIKVKKSNGTKN